jgi:hypothetical protein
LGTPFKKEMKIIITESQYERLVGNLPLFLKRRITQEDLDWMDNEVKNYLRYASRRNEFKIYFSDLLHELINEFVHSRKQSEVETEIDPESGPYYNEESLDNVLSLYWELGPYLKKIYEPMVRQEWEKSRK